MDGKVTAGLAFAFFVTLSHMLKRDYCGNRTFRPFDDSSHSLDVSPPVSSADALGHLSFWISLSPRLSLSPKFGLRPKISQKVKSFFVWIQRFDERFAKTKLRTERSLNPKLINSPVDFACKRIG